MIVHFLILHGKITEWIPVYILLLLTSILNWMQNVDINLWPRIIILRNIVLKFCPQLTWNGSIFAITSFIWQEEFYFKETILNIWTTEWLCLQNLIHKKSNLKGLLIMLVLDVYPWNMERISGKTSHEDAWKLKLNSLLTAY